MVPSSKILLYGAAGVTGRMNLSRLASRGHKSRLAGRDTERLAALGTQYALRIYEAKIDDPRHWRSASRRAVSLSMLPVPSRSPPCHLSTRHYPAAAVISTSALSLIAFVPCWRWTVLRRMLAAC
jgi:hypothetical protein